MGAVVGLVILSGLASGLGITARRFVAICASRARTCCKHAAVVTAAIGLATQWMAASPQAKE